MNGANNYNVCPRCGNSNPLAARYCSRCGEQLRIPEEPVVCHKCHTHNSPVANFCRNCGAELSVGLETKLCPRCGKEVNVKDTICTCGYSFVTYQQMAPSQVPVAEEEKVKSKKGGRAWAIVTLIFLLLFAYFAVAPALVRPAFLVNFDKGVVYNEEGVYYGYDYIAGIVGNATRLFGAESPLPEYGVANLIIAVLTVLTALTMAVQLLVSFVRIFTAKRSKHLGWYWLIVGILTLVVTALLVVFNSISTESGFLATVAKPFRLPADTHLGWVIWAIPVYYLFFFFVSLGAHDRQARKAAKENKKKKGNAADEDQGKQAAYPQGARGGQAM